MHSNPETLNGHWLDNKVVTGTSGETIAVHNPATDEVLGIVPSGTEAYTLKSI
jgi:acyl-CoA reductase-like NAD-dependent aldehyde dehydrogenase